MQQQSKQIRCFIAIELPKRIKDDLRQVESVLKAHDPSSAKWVDPNGIHLTLKFLGNVDGGRLLSIIDEMKEAAHATGPFRLGIEGLGAFPNLSRMQVVWIGVRGELERLAALQKELEDRLAEIGFPAEKRPFSPHLTLARLRETTPAEERQALGQLIAGLKAESELKFEVSSISLMQSQLTNSGAIYTQLASTDL